MKQLKYIMFLMALLAGSSLYAQEMVVDQTIPFHRWEIGLDLVPLIRTKTGFDFIIKKALHDNTKAIRFRAKPAYSFTSNYDYIPANNGVTWLNASFSIGLEKRKQWGKFMFYYAADANFIYELSNLLNDLNIVGPGISPSGSIGKDYSKKVGGGVSAIVGGKYISLIIASLCL